MRNACLLTKPDERRIEKFLAQQRALDFSYAAVGATRTEAPGGFDVDCNRVSLGRGERAFQSACEAMSRWEMFPVDWTSISPHDAPIAEGAVVAMSARCFGTWWLNGCQIVYTFDDHAPKRRFGFAYGTLPSHVECGEERFMIEMDEDGQVWYEISSFSRPRHWLVRLAYPLARWLQKRFVTDSLAQMRRIVASELAAQAAATTPDTRREPTADNSFDDVASEYPEFA